MEQNTAIDDSDKPCQTIGSLHEEILYSLRKEGKSQEKILRKNLARKVFNVLVQGELLNEATPNLIKRVVKGVLGHE